MGGVFDAVLADWGSRSVRGVFGAGGLGWEGEAGGCLSGSGAARLWGGIGRRHAESFQRGRGGDGDAGVAWARTDVSDAADDDAALDGGGGVGGVEECDSAV